MVIMVADREKIMNSILCSIQPCGRIEDIVEEAIQIVPESKKTAYLESLKRCPHLMESESNTMRFLERENYNSSDAAKRVISYWEDRKKAFGERAFHPLTSASYTEEAFFALWQGVYQILPNDRKGRNVVYCDDKILSRLSLKSRLQLVFFLDYIAQSNPLVLITAVDDISFDCTSKAVNLLIRNSMPTIVSSIHILCKNFSENDKTALRLVDWLMDEKTVVHSCRTIKERAQKLRPFNLDQDRLPKFLGGFANVNPWEGLDSQTSPVYCKPVETKTWQKEVDRLHLLNVAIANMPGHKKITFVEAMTLAPHIVETESNPNWFLEYDRFDIETAADRLVAYWEERKKAFGDKKFLPLTQENAYDDESKRALHEGIMVALPNDSGGRTVTFCDCEKIYAKPYRVRVQLMFYIYTMALQNLRSRKEGSVLVTLTPKIGTFPRQTDVIRIGRRVMPMGVYSVHLLRTGKEHFEGNGDGLISLPVLRFITGKRTYIHLAKSPGEYASKLAPYGLAKNCLPEIIGGLWKVDPGYNTKLQSRVDTTLKHHVNFGDEYIFSKEIVETNESISALMPRSVFRTGLALPATKVQTVGRKRESSKVIQGGIANKPQLFSNQSGRNRLFEIVRESRKLFITEGVNRLLSEGTQLTSHGSSIKEVLDAAVSELNSTLPSNGAQEHACENEKKRRRKIINYGVKPGKRQPGKFDVLLGQGKTNIYHPGNRYLHSLVAAKSDLYNEANQVVEKKRIRREIFDSIRKRKGSFLLEKDQCCSWYEVTDDVADRRIGQALRNKRQNLTSGKTP